MVSSDAIYVDFGNAEEDGAVRLTTAGSVRDLARLKIDIEEGAALKISDGEILADAVAHFRNGIWVAEIQRWEYIASGSD